MAGELHELSVAIGKLQEGQEHLAEAIRDIREVSTDEHRKVHDIVVATSQAVRNLAEDVAEMKPLTKDYELKRAEAHGVRHFLKGAWALAGGAVAVAAGKVLEYWSFRPPHP